MKYEASASIKEMFLNLRKEQRENRNKHKSHSEHNSPDYQLAEKSLNKYDDRDFFLENREHLSYRSNNQKD